VNLRAPTMLDHAFILECYEQWPVTETQGPITPYEVKLWIDRWMNRTDEVCLIAEIPAKVGLVTWRQNLFVAVIDNIVIHPGVQGRGYGKRLMVALQERLVGAGVVVAEFDAIPGRVADMVVAGRFERLGEGIGKSGLPIVKGRVMAGTEI